MSTPSKEKEVKKAPAKQEEVASVKGMRDLIGKEYYDFQGFMEKAAEISHYYGFKPIETPVLENTEIFTGSVGEGTDIVDKEMYAFKTRGGDQVALRPEGTAPIMRAYLENGMVSWPQPVMLYYSGTFYRHERPQRGRHREFRQFGLEVIGSEKSIGDAMVIKTFITVLAEAGVKDVVVDINSIGDKECRGAYRRALLAYYKKRLPQVCADCKNRFKTNPLRMLDCKAEQCQPIKKAAPDTISYLCPACKQHFKEVLEYLETLGIEYRINNALVRGLDYYSRTVFEFITREEVIEEGKEPTTLETVIGGGGRYDYLAKALGSKKDVPGVGGALGVDRILLLKDLVELAPRIIKKPKIFFIQLGFEAKLHSMAIIEILRKARIPIAQSLSKDGLGVQLATAERSKIPYTIILGQKEVIEKSVIVRNMDTRSQETVPVEKLAEYVKKLK
jgi:histidyl-tRNA synthetase